MKNELKNETVSPFQELFQVTALLTQPVEFTKIDNRWKPTPMNRVGEKILSLSFNEEVLISEHMLQKEKTIVQLLEDWESMNELLSTDYFVQEVKRRVALLNEQKHFLYRHTFECKSEAYHYSFLVEDGVLLVKDMLTTDVTEWSLFGEAHGPLVTSIEAVPMQETIEEKLVYRFAAPLSLEEAMWKVLLQY